MGGCLSTKPVTRANPTPPPQIIIHSPSSPPTEQSKLLHNLKSCGHDHCSLTTSRCCLCTDHRPPGYRDDGGGFERYVDGVGYVHDASRQEYYCPGCKQFLQTKKGKELFKANYISRPDVLQYNEVGDVAGPSNPPTYKQSVS